jgi:hypothetical protein
MTVILYSCGIYNLIFAIFHILFWKLFNWENELSKLNFANKAIMQILNLRIIYLFLMFSFIYLFYAHELLETKLRIVLIAGMFIFWLGRTVEQFVFFNFKSRRVNILTFVFILGSILHFLPLIN